MSSRKRHSFAPIYLFYCQNVLHACVKLSLIMVGQNKTLCFIDTSVNQRIIICWFPSTINQHHTPTPKHRHKNNRLSNEQDNYNYKCTTTTATSATITTKLYSNSILKTECITFDNRKWNNNLPTLLLQEHIKKNGSTNYFSGNRARPQSSKHW